MTKKMIGAAVLGTMAAVMAASCVQAEEKNPEITMEQIVEANMKENVLKNHSGYQVNIWEYGDLETKMYNDQDMTAWCWSDEAGATVELHMGPVLFGSYEGEYGATLLADETEIENQSYYDNSFLELDSTFMETIEEVRTDGDQWQVITSMAAENMNRPTYEFEEGDTVTMEYTLDPDTLEIFSLVETVTKADGTTEVSGTVDIAYDVEMPEEVSSVYEKMQEEPQRTVTMVLDPDTEEEQTYSISLVQGIPVGLYISENYTELYTDRECTKISEEEVDVSKSVTLYSKANEE